MSMSILMVCRLCLYNASDYVDLGTDDPNNLREKILKYLLVEVSDGGKQKTKKKRKKRKI